MAFLRKLCFFLAAASQVYAGFDPNSKSNIVLYWGQNSAGQQSTQNRLINYCNDVGTDVILLAFLLRFNGPGGHPIMNFANQGDKCDTFPGTQTFLCPEIEADIKTCQSLGKTVMLSLGGDAYTEGGFATPDLAIAEAHQIWATFGPAQPGSNALRPFGSAIVDGFDFDFEATVSNMAVFGNTLRALMDNGNRAYYLSAAPQCPFPDIYNKEILENVPLDFVHVQFYNNGCGASSFVPGSTEQWNFNFDQWDAWAKSSKNPAVRVLMGVPANTGAGRGYLSPSALAPVVEYSRKFTSFGGMMMWDASQAWMNTGFMEAVQAIAG